MAEVHVTIFWCLLVVGAILGIREGLRKSNLWD